MSVINNINKQHSEQFQILQPQINIQQNTDQLIIQLSDWNLPSFISSQQQNDQDITVGIFIDQQTFIVLQKKQSNQNNQIFDWKQFCKKKINQINQEFIKTQNYSYEYRSRITLRQRNAIISLGNNQTQQRKKLWQIANYNQNIQQQFIFKQKQDQQNRQQILTIFSYQLTQSQIKNLKRNIFKINKILKSICEERYQNVDAHRLYVHQKEIMQWIYDSLIRYAIQDQQVRYCKGLQYICLGIVVAYPIFDLAKYTQLLYHFLNINGFKQLYYQGTPRFFKQLQRIKQGLRQQSPKLFQKIQQNEGDFKNLFVTYFRSCLIYRINKAEIIRKIFELLFIEGIQVMRTIIIRIIDLEKQKLIKSNNLLENISSQIIFDYFQNNQVQTIQQKFQRLFAA